MMKKRFLTMMMVFLGLFAGVNTMKGQEGQAMYLAAFKAQAAPESTGSGTVKLTWIDAQGKLFTNSIVSFLNLTGMPEGYQMPYATGNPSNGNEFAENALMVGTTMTATESVEESSTDPTDAPGTFVLRLMLNNYHLDTVNIFMTPYAYFKADAQGDAGSYFAGWTFNDARVWQQDTAMDKSAPGSAYFKVLPNPTNIYYMAPPSTVTGLSEAYTGAVGAPNNIYAVFKKYLLSNPTATSGMVAQIKDASKELYVDVDVEGDMSQMKADHSDFATPSFSNVDAYSSWTCAFAAPTDYEVVSATKRRYHFVVTYTALEGITEGKHSATLTIKMAGTSASTLTIPMSVMVRPESANDASVKIGNAEPTAYETLSAAVNAANSASGDVTLTLLRNVSTAIELSNTMTLDLNGYTLSNTLTVNGSGKTVTLVYNKLGGEISGAVSVSAGTLVLNGGKLASLSVSAGATVEQNGASITGATENAGLLTTTAGEIQGGLTSTAGTLTLKGGTFNGTNAVTVSGGTAYINKGTLNGSSCGLLVSGGTANVKKLAVINSDGSYSAQRTAGTLNVESGKFNKPLNGTINFTAGYFKTNSYGVSTEDKTEFLVSAGVEYEEGYRYFLGDAESALTNGVGVCRIGTTSYARLEDALAYANNNPNEEVVIFMTNDYTLPAGYYTLPAKATIVVPMSDMQAKEINYVAPRLVYNDINNSPSDSYENNIPTEFRRLTFASGVNMDVFGDIELTCTQFTTNAAYTSQPVGAYGRLVMEEGSHMILQNGSELRAWGFMTGKGETDARRGATVREMFQMGDWKGAMTSVAITGMVKDNSTLSGVVQSVIGGESGDYSDKKIFPVSQYFIQNVESPVKYHPGALLTTSATVSEGISMGGMNMSISMAATDIAVVGVSGEHTAIFLMDIAADAENTWVRKWYDAENDIQVYEINSGAHIGSMELDMGELSLMGMSVPVRLNSGLFDLPITSNFKIHLLSGTMDFKQNTCLLPGSEVEVDKESTVTVAMNDDDKAAKEAGTPDHVYHSGAVYVYDQTDWDRYAYNKKFTKVVRYAPSALNGEGGQPNLRSEDTNPASAKINVHGTFNTADGYVYTSAGGANIYSSNEDAGTFIFSNAASEAGDREVWQIKGKGTSNGNYEPKTFTVAKLKNGDNSYTETSATGANQVYMYKNDEWHTAPALFYFDCFTAEVDMEKYAEEAGKKASEQPYDLGSAVQHIYIKPQEWVEIVGTAEIEFNWSEPADYENDPYNPYLVGVTGNSDHTFSDAAGTGRLFILMDDGCQWWEVENVDNLYHCIHPNNDTYYYWGVDPVDGKEKWLEKKFTITWKNWNGEAIVTNNGEAEGYEVSYGTMAEFLGTNPTRENNIDSTYNFTGWKPALGPVTQDVTYTATFESQPRMYTIIFQNEGGTEIERQFLTHNAVPVCENTPTKIGHTLVWSPAISPVIGDQTYTATWLENPPTEWDVTFVNNAGGSLQETASVGVNDHPVYSGSTPAKENADHTAYSSNEYTYTFWGWSAVIDGVAQQFAAGDELPCPTAPTTYTAVYTEAQKTYVVRFLDEKGNLIPEQEYNLPYGAMPVCSATPTKENTAEWTYGFAWDPQIQTVMASEDPVEYRATFPATKNKYTVTLTSNLSGVCTFTGAGTFDYYNNEGKEPEDEDYVEPKIVTVSYDSEKYNFLGWEDGEENASRTIASLESDVTLTANFMPIALSDHTVAMDATWAVLEDTEVKDLIITSDGSACGQLLNPENLTIRGEAIFRMDQSFADGQWYAVAVPWRVNPVTGIYGASSRLALGSQIYIIEFDGAAYANVGGTDDTNQYWHFLHETGADMVPGKLYMIYLTSAQSKLDFHKKAGAALQTRNLTVSTASGSAGASFANWNAISNPALYTADLSTGVTVYQTYDNNGGQTYTVVDATTSSLIVAKPIFVQVNTPSMVYATVSSSPDPAPAYRRAPQAENDTKFVVEISRNGKMADRLIVETADEKADSYVIGQDLAKFGISRKVAQMWINRYDSKLCKNTVEMSNDCAEYPLSIYAPTAGEYTIYLTPYTNGSDYALYLTRNGVAIANLNEGEYTLYLDGGTTNEYGLRIGARAPQTTTGMDEAVVDAQGEIKKVLINNQVFIIRGDKVYTIDGQLVR